MIINLFSEVLRRALPIKGLRTIEERVKMPIRMPISILFDPDPER
jgi:hypothetical protein